jgi:putative peptidoglycan lipid II flippase
VLRVVLTTALGYLAAIPLPGLLGIPNRWGVAGLTASAGVAAWVEFVLLRRALNRRIGATGLDARFTGRLWAASALAAAAGGGLALLFPRNQHPIALAVAVIGVYGVVYFSVVSALGVAEAGSYRQRLNRIWGR